MLKTFLIPFSNGAFAVSTMLFLSACVNITPARRTSITEPSNPAGPQGTSPLRPLLVANNRVFLSPTAGAGAQKMEHNMEKGMKEMSEMKHSPETSTGAHSKTEKHEMTGMSHDKSTDKPDSSSNATLNVKSYYTCPMHPEIRNPGPGDCPICGMKLVKKSVDQSQ